MTERLPYIDIYQYMYFEAKYSLLMNNRKKLGLKHCNDLKAFIEYSLIWKMFMKILMNSLQIKNSKY